MGMSEVGNLRAVEGVQGDPDKLPAKVARCARIMAENQTEGSDLIGFVTVAVYSDGAYSCGYQCPEDHLIGPTLFTAYAKEVIERQLTGAMAAEDYAKEFLS
jgi:hypothetical protein